MLSPITWLLRSIPKSKKTRIVKTPGHAFIENLESRQLLTTIFSEGFEFAFPGSDFVTNSDSGRKWDDTNDKAHTGGWSAFCADLDNDTDQTSYLNNLDTTFTRIVDLSDFRNVELEYWRFVNTELNFDELEVTVSKAGVGSVTSAAVSGNLQSWVKDTLQIPESLWGQSNVTVQFKFHSDGSVVTPGTAGVWVDDILMSGVNDDGFPESTISTPSGVNLRLNQFGDVTNYTSSIASAGDLDTYGFGVDNSGSYTITVSGAVDVQLRIYDASGNALTPIIDNSGSGGTETWTLNRTAGEACYFQVGGYTTATGSYSINVTGPSDGVETELTPSPTYDVNDSGSIDYAGDRDYYKFTAPLDTTTLSITLNNSANLDGVLTLFSSTGQNLQQIDAGFGGDSEQLVNFAVTAGESYILMVSGFAMHEGDVNSESYSFTADFGPDNVGKPPSIIDVPTGTNLRLNQFGDISGVGSSIANTLDYKTFAFGVETTGNYTITAGGAVDTELRVYDSNGNAITAIQDAFGVGTETLNVNLTAGQTCYFVVGGYNSGTGSFTVSVNGPSVNTSATNFSAPNYFVSGNGAINSPGDRDYFNITAPNGTNALSIILNSSASLDGVISLFDSNGNLLQQKDAAGTGGAESIVSFAVTAGQNYYVAFSGFAITEGSGGAESNSYSLDFGPDLADVNVAPDIPAGQDLPIAENSAAGTVVGAVVANDANSTAPNNVLTYSILNGAPSNPFSINANTGVITYVGPGTLNFENIPQYTLTVKVTDGGALFTTQAVTISVSDVNETPSIPAGQTLQVLENSDVGTVVGTVNATDPDTVAPNSTLTYSIVSGLPNNPFSIDAATGQITVANPAALNFETTPQFTLQVKVTDGGNGNLNATQTVTINLIDANDAPSIAAGQQFSLPENSSVGASVGTVVATDPDTTAPNKTLAYSITGGNTNTAFAINPTTGLITVNNASAIDFEVNPSFTLTINVTDGGSLFANQTVVVNLTNVNEAPTLSGAPIGSPTFVFKAGTPVTVFPSISVKDPDGDAELATVTMKVSIPTGTKSFDVINVASAAGLGSIADSVVGGKHQYILTLNAGVTTSQVESFLRSITFSSSKKSLKTLTRTFEVSVTDIHGATSNLVTQSVNVKKK